MIKNSNKNKQNFDNIIRSINYNKVFSRINVDFFLK